MKQMMGELSRTGLVKTNVSFGTRTAEYAVKFDDGKLLAIDSKVVGTSELERLNDDRTNEEKRNQIVDDLTRRIRDKIDEVAGYVEPGRKWHTAPPPTFTPIHPITNTVFQPSIVFESAELDSLPVLPFSASPMIEEPEVFDLSSRFMLHMEYRFATFVFFRIVCGKDNRSQ